MQESTIPLITVILILGIITLLFFVNEFFRKYNVVKKQKPRKRKGYPKLRNLTNKEMKDMIRSHAQAQGYFIFQQNKSK